ncbi:MAG: hypothetical protein RLZ55_1138 [Actinomycetota bacterium]|jgi:molybdopterin-guanine dinucleotide biosynthesis protein A
MGRDKAGVRLGDRSLLEHVLDSLPDVPVVCVGPAPDGLVASGDRVAGGPIQTCREDPPGGGPAAAVAAALPLVRTTWFGLIGTDMPFAGAVLRELAALAQRAGAGADGPDAEAQVDGWTARDIGGTAQPLCGVYRSDACRAMVARLPPGGAEGLPLRDLLGVLRVRSVDVASPDRLRDLDTPADLAAAQAILGGEEMIAMDKTEDFLSRAATALGVGEELDTALVLDVARDVAHGVERPAAPLSTYLLGVAVGRGADPQVAAEHLRGAIGDGTD